MMRAFRLALLLVLFASFELGTAGNSIAVGTSEKQDEEAARVKFRWAFGAVIMSEKNPRLVSVEPEIVLHSGDQLKAFLELQENCHVYWVYQSAQEEIRLLFPSDVDELSAGNSWYIPEGDSWFELDAHTGIETFHLIASEARLVKLEGFFQKYGLLSPAEKQEGWDQILREIQTLKRRHRQLKTVAERPVQIVGGIRGGDETKPAFKFDPASLAVEICARKFYSRTFTIDHQ